MKTISSQLAAHFGQDTTTLAVLWKATRNDGQIFGFNTHDKDIVFDDGSGSGPITYFAATGFTYSATETKSDLSPDNLEVTGFLNSGAITENDIRAGRWDNALIQVFILNWADTFTSGVPAMGFMRVRQGVTGVLKMKNGVFTAELRGLTQQLTTTIGSMYGPVCRAEFGSGLNGIDMDSHYFCNIDVTLFRQTGSVNTSPDLFTIVPPAGSLKMVGSSTPTVAAPVDWFKEGLLQFTSGVMSGFYVEIKGWDGTTLTTYLPMPYQPQPSDTFSIEPGCDKTPDTCFRKYNNIVNFRGEPFIPGNDLILLYPNAK